MGDAVLQVSELAPALCPAACVRARTVTSSRFVVRPGERRQCGERHPRGGGECATSRSFALFTGCSVILPALL